MAQTDRVQENRIKREIFLKKFGLRQLRTKIQVLGPGRFATGVGTNCVDRICFTFSLSFL